MKHFGSRLLDLALSVLAAVLLLVIRMIDMYEREPLGVVATMAFWGAIASPALTLAIKPHVTSWLPHRNDIARAMSAASLDTYRANGVAGKAWLQGSDFDDECTANEAEGPIGLDEDFSSGDSAPPAHPNCDCVLLPVQADEMGQGAARDEGQASEEDAG